MKRCEFCFLKSQCKETVSIKSTFVNPANLFRMKVSKLQYCVITAKSLVCKQNNLHTKPSRNSCTTYILLNAHDKHPYLQLTTSVSCLVFFLDICIKLSIYELFDALNIFSNPLSIHHAFIGINWKYCGSVNTPYVFIDVKPQMCVQSQVLTVRRNFLWKRYDRKCIISIKDLQMSCLTQVQSFAVIPQKLNKYEISPKNWYSSLVKMLTKTYRFN